MKGKAMRDFDLQKIADTKKFSLIVDGVQCDFEPADIDGVVNSELVIKFDENGLNLDESKCCGWAMKTEGRIVVYKGGNYIPA
jgi:hypothetical protein